MRRGRGSSMYDSGCGNKGLEGRDIDIPTFYIS